MKLRMFFEPLEETCPRNIWHFIVGDNEFGKTKQFAVREQALARYVILCRFSVPSHLQLKGQTIAVLTVAVVAAQLEKLPFSESCRHNKNAQSNAWFEFKAVTNEPHVFPGLSIRDSSTANASSPSRDGTAKD
jgi:hypothetical protein